MSETLKPCPFCGGPATEIVGLVGCEPCAIGRRDAQSWNRREPAFPEGTLFRVVGGKVERVEADVVGALHESLGCMGLAADIARANGDERLAVTLNTACRTVREAVKALGAS